MQRISPVDLIWLLLYGLLLTGVTVAMFYARARILNDPASVEKQAEWEEWRETVRRGETDQVGPVKRRVPKSLEPPTTVLMRDHFPTCLVGLLVISSVLFATLVFFARGVLSQRGRVLGK